MVPTRIVCFKISLLTFLYIFTQAEIFTTGDKRLFKTQEAFIKYLENFFAQDPKKIYFLKRQLEIFKREHERAMEDIPNYLDNPINVFTLIKRLTVDIQDIRDIMRNATDNIGNFDSKMAFKYEGLVIPSEEDLMEAARAIIRLQDTYQLDVEDIADGNLNGIDHRWDHHAWQAGWRPQYDGIIHRRTLLPIFWIMSPKSPFTTPTGSVGSPMSAGDCFELGLRLYSDGDFTNAFSWIMEALLKYKRTTDVYLFTENDILIYIDALFQLSRDIPQLPEDPIPNEIENYFSLCRGEKKISYLNDKRLVCYYLSGEHPTLRLAPIKVEQLHSTTDVFLFYDMISDGEAEILKNVSAKKLHRSLVQRGPVKHPDDTRISKQTWLKDEHSKVVAALSRRVSVFTGLNVESAEPLQILNYGIGGYYEPHYDFAQGNENRNNSTGERIATVLIYLSEVAQGGATVFTELGLSVFPIKNAALFWLNLHPSGEGNLATLHAACPVLKGSKWVATKWLHEGGQALQCSKLTRI